MGDNMCTVSDMRLKEVYPGFSKNPDFYRDRIDRATFQATETFIHNLNTKHSKAEHKFPKVR